MMFVIFTLLAISGGIRTCVAQTVLLETNELFLSTRQSCDNSSFPIDFKFGAGSSAYQVEGAWNEDGKGRSWWDWLVNSYSLANGNTATDSYHKYEEDVAAIQEIGLDYYRFSLSWPRILPKGLSYSVNQAGVDYYNNLLDKLEEAGIEPLVTIFHWDTPLALEYLGDWTSPKMVEYYVAYADLAFSLFGDRVKLWSTINEPKSFCQLVPATVQAYFFPELPIGTYEYLCGHYALLAHAHAYRLYQIKYKIRQRGRLGIALDLGYNIPLTDSVEDLEAAERATIFDYGWFANPIVYGDYPQLMKDVIATNSANQNFSISRLPTFTLAEKQLLRGSYDVFMLNTYTTNLVTAATYDNTPSYANDKQITSSLNSTWPVTNTGFAVYPKGIRKILNYIKDSYRNPEIFITENGYSDTGGLNDTARIAYIQDELQQVRLAMCEDDVKVTRYTYWSLLDSFEWTTGFTTKFGLVQVDFSSTNLTRTLKESAYYYRNLIETRLIDATSSV